jgi:pyrroloquinoline-quinone synthase
MTTLIQQLDAERERLNTLRHPFYLKWSAGELSRDELAVYAGQYRHAVVALAELAARDGDREHAREEAAHIELWDAFVDGVGGTRDEPTPETQAFVDALRVTDGAGIDAVLYSLESMQPPVSESKLDGLQRFYGFSADEPACAYFRVHSTLDDEHARQAAERLETRSETDGALASATAALEANWRLLDGVTA